MNLCKDCKHFALDGKATVCKATAISLIDGEARHSVDHCIKARGRNGRCGLEGRLFEGLKADVIVVDELEQPKANRKTRAQRGQKEVADVQAE
ncbi:hypothetical protein phi3MF5_27 [Pseudomonas phage vB_PsyP_3MF5]|uniref:hypothetical protein n=1 Tax=Pseudomonas phage vB_PsyP_3MF5 TaxID=2749426 RepID=UPI001BD962D1|nr:hypothetical protein KMB82_gp27 [Pseudomonas phage vB_PsyP_3MF5]QLI47578.1 hypothetical protein phi3MF5_27 [Pseudomonas phage vB_PsyP_3MF5]